MNTKIKELLESEEFAQQVADSIVKEHDWQNRYVNLIKERIVPLSNAEFTALTVRLCEWETEYEEMYYARHIQTTSNLFNAFFEAISQLGGARPCKNEMFLYEKYIYKGLTFKLYVGQGSFHRITMGKRLIFQSN